jgi:prepilin-type N-terminal cleavage/methylation domain-containing protein
MGALPKSRRQAGFTLIEVLAAVFLTTMVIGIAVSFYINLSDHSMRAAKRMRETLHAVALLDRVANDVRAASMIVKAEDADPLSHPWYFVAEQYASSYGADRVKFITRSNQPRVTAYHSSDLAQVAYFMERDGDGGFLLYRWLAPGLPESFDLDFPDSDNQRSLLLGENIASFGMRFLGEDGEWTEAWDSSQLLQSGQLPHAVEIVVSMLPSEGADPDEFLDVETLRTYRRNVALPMRPLDLLAMIQDRDVDEAAAEASGLNSALAGAWPPQGFEPPGPDDCQNQAALVQQCVTYGQPEATCQQAVAGFCAAGGVLPEL